MFKKRRIYWLRPSHPGAGAPPWSPRQIPVLISNSRGPDSLDRTRCTTRLKQPMP